MFINVVMITTYIVDCFAIGTGPWKFFQLNAPHFNSEKGIFSKIDLDDMFPEEWRLSQRYDADDYLPEEYPVFLKPEWGQNAGGIHCARNIDELTAIRRELRDSRVPYIIQQAAPEKREFEIFAIRSLETMDRPHVFTITEVINDVDEYPINSVQNPGTSYREITQDLDASQLEQLWALTGRIGRFTLSRLCARANTVEDLLAGRFHIVELNLYNPMPMHFMDSKYSPLQIWRMIWRDVTTLARITKNLDPEQEVKPVYWNLKLYNRKNPVARWLRNKI